MVIQERKAETTMSSLTQPRKSQWFFLQNPTGYTAESYSL